MSWRFVLMLSLSALVMTSCFEDLDDVDRPASTLQINDFIWRGLNYFYLYKEQVPMLSDAAFDNEGDEKQLSRQL